MTNEEAINRLQDAKDGYKEYLTDEALEMAIQALEKENIYDDKEHYVTISKALYDKLNIDYEQALSQEQCDDAISRKAVLKLKHHKPEYGDMIYAFDVEQLPPVMQKSGKWIDADGDNAICSCCNRLNHLYGTYCKHCGAKMESEEE